MQINLSTNLPNATGAGAAKSSESAETGSASAFFAQMGQIWDPEGESSDTKSDKKPEESVSTATVPDPMTLLFGATLISPRLSATEPPPVRNLSGFGSGKALDGENSNSDVPMKIPVGTASVQSNSTTSPGQESFISGSNDDAAKEAFRLIDEAVEVPPASSACADAKPDSQPELPLISDKADGIVKQPAVINNISLDAGREFVREMLRIKNPQEISSNDESAERLPVQENSSNRDSKAEDLMGAGELQLQANTNREAGNLQARILTKLEDKLPDINNHPDMKTLQVPEQNATHNKAQLELPLRKEPASAAKDLNVREIGDSPRDSGLKDEIAHAANPRKSGINIPANSGNSNTGDSSEEGSQSYGGEGFSSTQAAKQHSSHPNVGQLRPLADEHSQDVHSVIASAPTRFAETTGAAKTPATSAPDAQPQEFIFQLANQIRIQLKEGREEIRIQLKPDSLGRLEINAEATANGVTARITTESNSIKSYLENNLQYLQQTLQDQGLRVDRIHIVVQDAFDSRSASGFSAQFGHAGSGQDGNASQSQSPSSGFSPASPSEEIIIDPATWFALNPNSRFYTVA